MNHYEIFTDAGRGLFAQRLEEICQRVEDYLEAERQQYRTLSYTKVFLSDISNQEEELRQSPLMIRHLSQAACTIIQQSPIGGA